MAGRGCTVCASAEKAAIAREMIAAGRPDREIAERLGVGRMAVSRHRWNHIEKPARAIAEAASKALPVRREREKLLEHAKAGDLNPADFLALGSIVSDLRDVRDRLSRVADEAEAAGSHSAVASLAAQSLRAAEVRSRLAGHGGFGKPTVQAGEGAPTFTVNFHFSGGSQQLGMTPGQVVEHQPVADEAAPATPRLDFGRLARALTANTAAPVDPLDDQLDDE